MSTVPILEAVDLGVHFRLGRGRLLRAVDGVSLVVRAGETFGVIGESGSGKTTLGRALVCLERPAAGRVRHGGVDPFALTPRALRRHRRDYQVIFQDPNAALDPRMSILRSVQEPLDVARELPRAQREGRALAMLERVGLGSEFADRYPHELSGGQKQRVCIARALTLQPSVIVCDEAVAALDVSIQADILNLLAGLQREFGLTYLFITHNLGVVAHVSDRIAVMYLGRLVEQAETEALMARPLHPYTEALLSSEPVALPSHLRRQHRVVLQGELPSPVSPPSGCRFRTRCAYAAARCTAEEPAWREVRPGHWAACHFAGTLPEGARPHPVEVPA
ncbi:dipeptide ABC transporter ATP binding subunit DppF [Rhodovastum atsumiense]|uniref:ATP-binding cassette domain-containing protein n=1 Tax=Rhodovastum atsumiense TaxID=504468 RepID=A0A5M6IYN0_9PROT|nr:oligopeptide/dipeptide ABC transporter ATP-binding protein [Rhodovastum atsumiense]KAA5613454.1 ATP-binding cassette domain-containing protein [Rhodovastum atsumiense]CAH2603189.1 dipeptide ABC transporter ATP binding subunit DppF [Rhodovastum atsumiense]